jgi:transcriptional antiterminator NusG
VDMGNWFVFYVKTGSEQEACDFLNKVFDKKESVAFIPQIETILRNSKSIIKCLKPMFPGYVFLDSTLDEAMIVNITYKYTRLLKCIYRILGKENFTYMKIDNSEKKFLLQFLNDEYVTEESKGLIIGDKIYVTLGPLKGRESIIKKIDRHKRRAEIEIACFGELRRINVSLEVVYWIIKREFVINRFISIYIFNIHGEIVIYS